MQSSDIGFIFSLQNALTNLSFVFTSTLVSWWMSNTHVIYDTSS